MLPPSLADDPDPAAAGEPDADADVGPARRWRRPRTARPRVRSRRRRIIRGVGLTVAVLVVPVGWSYAHALTGPGSDSTGARTVEWMREHHLGGLVDTVERRWYDHHQAKVGGAPDVAVAAPDVAGAATAPTVAPTPTTDPAPSTAAAAPATVAPAAAAPATAAVAPATAPTTAPPPASPAPVTAPSAPVTALAPPAALATPAASPVPGEGQWTPIGPGHDGTYGAYGTLIRPDGVHTSVLDAVVWIDPHLLALRQYPGAKIPGAPWDRPDHVETARQHELVAAFEGGFRLADSRGGMILGGTTLAPMRDGAATLTIDVNGVPDIGRWGRDVTASPTLDSARQNLDLIVDGGAPVPSLLHDPNRAWGFTGPANKSAVWRSGAGITADGALVWVGGPGLTIEALAETLVRAGAVRGMQLDINHEWVQLDTYTTAPDGTVSGRRVLPGMQHTANRWLTEDTRDFVAVFSRG